MRFFYIINSFLILLFTVLHANATSILELEDGRSAIKMGVPLVQGDTTYVTFWTYPQPQDGIRKRCNLNFYAVAVHHNGELGALQEVGKDLCANGFMSARYLEDQSVVILGRESLEKWRAGKALARLKIKQPGGGFLNRVNTGLDNLSDISPDGGLLSVVDNRLLVSFDLNGKVRWKAWIPEKLDPASKSNARIFKVSATGNGGALVRLEGSVPSSGNSYMPTMKTVLYHFNNQGKRTRSAEYSEQVRSHSVQVANLSKGGMAVLARTGSSSRDRKTVFKVIDGNGNLRRSMVLDDQLTGHGIERWDHFGSDGEHIYLLNRVSATQPDGKRYQQLAVSTITPESGRPDIRLIPIDQRFVKKARASRDEDRGKLQNLPGGFPLLVAPLGSHSVAVSKGRLSGKRVLRFDVVTPELAAYTEAFDQLQADQRKKQLRAERKQRNKEFTERGLKRMADQVGMTPEEFSRLSGRERKALLLQSGNPAEMMGELMEGMQEDAELLQSSDAKKTVQGCDCSCDGAKAMRKMMQGVRSGKVDPAVIQEGAQCQQQCAMKWIRCY